MASAMKSLITDGSRFLRAFHLYLERSSEEQLMTDFIHNQLPAELESVGRGKSRLNVIGLGSGSGELDLQMLSELHLKHPDAVVDNEVVEPNPQQLQGYKALVSQTPGLDYINFNWNQMTEREFQDHWEKKEMTRKVDFCHMLQMLYYAEDYEATVIFFKRLLDKNGKLLVILMSEGSAWGKLWEAVMSQQSIQRNHNYVTIGHIKRLLDSRGMNYQSYELESQLDITECFTDGDETGELLLDFITMVKNFSQVASPELKARVREFLRGPECSVEVNGKILMNNNFGVIISEQLT